MEKRYLEKKTSLSPCYPVVINEDGTWEQLNTTANTSVTSEHRANTANTAQLPFAAMPLTKQAALLFVVAQSNGERGDAIPAAAQKGASFFTHVKTLKAAIVNANINDESKWAWVPFTTAFDYNLGRAVSGQLYTMATSFALKWQERVNAGAKLPILHLIQVSHSSFGFSTAPATEQPQVPGIAYRPELGGFNPLHDENPQPVYQDIPPERLWDFIPRLNRWAIKSLVKYNQKLRHLGVFYNQWEHDAVEGDPSTYKQYLTSFLKNAFDDEAGVQVPFYYMYPRGPWATNPPHPEKARRFALMQRYFDEIEKERPNAAHFDIAKTTLFNPNESLLGAYVDDFHFKGNVFKDFFAQKAIDRIEGTNGVTADDANNGILITELKAEATGVSGASAAVLPTEWLANKYALSADSTIPGWIVSGPAKFKVAVSRISGRRVFNFPTYGNPGSEVRLYSMPALPTDTKFFEFDITMLKGSRFGAGIMLQGQNATSTFAGFGKTFVYLGLSIDVQDVNYNGGVRLKIWNLTAGAAVQSNVALTAQPTYTSADGFANDTVIRYKKFLDGTTEKVEVLYSVDKGATFTSMVTAPLTAASIALNGGVGSIGIAMGLGIPRASGIGQNMRILSVTAKSLE